MTHGNETAQLAPAAGQGVGKILFDRLLAESDFIDLMVAGIRSGLEATFPRRWDKQLGGWAEGEPDGKTRVHTVLGVLAQAEGEPIKRIIHQHLGGDGSGIDPLAALRDSPALLAAVEREVEKAKWRTSGNSEHKRPKAQRQAYPVEIEVPELRDSKSG